MRDEIIGGKGQHSNLYFTLNIIRMLTSKKVKWSAHVSSANKRRNPYQVLVGKPEGRKTHMCVRR
jgi:hypothetical protein